MPRKTNKQNALEAQTSTEVQKVQKAKVKVGEIPPGRAPR
jgi:hypothetical protein